METKQTLRYSMHELCMYEAVGRTILLDRVHSLPQHSQHLLVSLWTPDQILVALA